MAPCPLRAAPVSSDLRCLVLHSLHRRCQRVDALMLDARVCRRIFHGTCFRCHDCGVKLASNNWCVDSYGSVYCKSHFMQRMKAGGGKYDLSGK